MPRWRKLGIIAGAGALPRRAADACLKRGAPFFVLRIAGVADEATADFPGAECGLAEFGKAVRLLRAEGCDAVTLAGLVRRPNFADLRPDWRGAALLPKVLAAAARGDGAILESLVDSLEAEGFIVVGAEEVADDILATAGAFGAVAPDAADFADIRKAAALIAAIGPFDAGQAAVVAGGHVLAVEAAEGTDAMLERCAGLRAEAGRAGVLVKRPKPGQELRVDLPTIGADTVRRAIAAGLKGVAVEAGLSLVLDRDAVVAAADANGLFVYGFTNREVQSP